MSLKPKNVELILGDDLWTVEFVRRNAMPSHNGRPAVGLCYWDDKRILVRKDLCTLSVLDTFIHEMRHAQHPVMFEAESFIEDTSTELARGLIAAGFIKD
jgi:hypothetical protein